MQTSVIPCPIIGRFVGFSLKNMLLNEYKCRYPVTIGGIRRSMVSLTQSDFRKFFNECGIRDDLLDLVFHYFHVYEFHNDITFELIKDPANESVIEYLKIGDMDKAYINFGEENAWWAAHSLELRLQERFRDFQKRKENQGLICSADSYFARKSTDKPYMLSKAFDSLEQIPPLNKTVLLSKDVSIPESIAALKEKVYSDPRFSIVAWIDSFAKDKYVAIVCETEAKYKSLKQEINDVFNKEKGTIIFF